jgi:hypothetical protein
MLLMLMIVYGLARIAARNSDNPREKVQLKMFTWLLIGIGVWLTVSVAAIEYLSPQSKPALITKQGVSSNG